MVFPVIPRNQTRHFPGQFFALFKMLAFAPSAETVGSFENEIAKLTGASYAVSFSSARSSCRAVLQSMNYPNGSAILMPSLNYPAIPKTVNESGLRIIWLPLRRDNLHPDFDSIRKDELNGAVALIWPHHFGFPGPMDEICRFCANYKLDLIEDCAHALGAFYKGKHVGTFGRAAFISFETSKMINTFGGGVVITSDAEIAKGLENIRRQLPSRKISSVIKGAIKSYVEFTLTSRLGFTFSLYPALLLSKALGRGDFLVEGLQAPAAREIESLSPIQAAVGFKQLKYFERDLSVLKQQFAVLEGLLESAGLGVRVSDEGEPNGYMTAGISENAYELARALFKKGIDVKMHYMLDCQDLGFGTGGDRCEKLSDKLFHLPNRTGLSEIAMANYTKTIDKIIKDFV